MAHGNDTDWDVHLQLSDGSSDSGDAPQPPEPKPLRGRGRGGGRPRGSRGFHQVLEARIQAHAAADEDEQEEAEPGHALALPVPEATELVPQPLVQQLGTPTQRAMVLHSSRNWDKKPCETECKVLDFHLRGMHCTSAAAARLLDHDAKSVRQKLFEFAWVLTAGGGWMWGALMSTICQMVQSDRWRPVMAFRKIRFDETPTALRVELSEDLPVGPAGSSGLEWQDQTKVVQLEASLAFLVQDMESQQYVLLHGHLPAALQAVDSCTGETIMASIRSVFSHVPEFHRTLLKFPLRVLHACTDGAGANFRAEAGVKAHYWELQPSMCCVRLHLSCELHKAALCAKSANDLASMDTAGVLAVGLACASTGSARKLRRLLKDLLAERLQIIYEQPPEMPAYNKQVLDLYLPFQADPTDTKRMLLKRRFTLTYWLNSDWQSPDIRHYARADNAEDEARLRSAFLHYTTWALIPKKCPVYARGRWTQYDLALQWCGLLLSVHGLLPYLMAAFCGHVGPTASSVPEAPTQRPENQSWDAMLVDVAPDPAMGLSETLEPVAESVGPAEPEEMDWASFNKAQRSKAAVWARTDPVARVAVNLQVASCILTLVYEYLFLGSARWEQEQRAKAARGEARAYAITEIASRKHLQKCTDKLVALLRGPPTALPLLQHTRGIRALFFSMISAALCSLHAQLEVRHAGCPFAIFRAVLQGWDDFLQLPSCMHDEFTAAIVRKFPDECALSSDECMATLLAVASLASTDIGAIEASHAKNRDISKMRASAWQPTLAFVSGKFVVRKFSQAKEMQATRQQIVLQEREAAKSHRRPRQKRPGGPWRAFVHVQMQMLPGRCWEAALLRQLAVDYRNLTPEVKLFYKELGYLANAAGRHGFKPFGPALADRPRAEAGTENSDGAIVAADDASVLACALSGMSSHQFDSELAMEQQKWPARTSKQAALNEEVALLADFASKSQDSAALSASLSAHGLHSSLAKELEGVPGHPALREVIWHPPLERLAHSSLCASTSTKQNTIFASSIRQAWQTGHRVLCHAEVPPCSNDPASVFKLTACREHGCCVCGKQRGQSQSLRDLPRVKQRLQSLFGKIFSGTQKNPSAALSLLRQGRIVVKLQLVREDWTEGALAALLDEGCSRHNFPQHMFLHIGYCNYRSFACAFLPLRLVHNPNSDGFMELSAAVADNPEAGAQTLPQVLAASFAFSKAYELSVFEIVTGSTPLLSSDRMHGHIVEVRPCDFFETSTFWKGSAQEPAKRQRRQAGRPSRRPPGYGRPKRPRRAAESVADADLGDEENQHHDADAEMDDVGELFADDASDAASAAQSDEEADLFSDDGGSQPLPSEVGDDLDDEALQEADRGTSSDGNGEDPGSSSSSSSSSDSSDSSSSSSSLSLASVAAGAECAEEADQHSNDGDAAEAAPRPRAAGGARREPTVQRSIDIPGKGQLRYSAQDSYMRAFCSTHGGACQRQRTLNSSERKQQQGRCIGALVAWLSASDQHETKQSHVKARAASHAERCAARALFMALPHADEWADYERPRRAGEPDEPLLAP